MGCLLDLGKLFYVLVAGQVLLVHVLVVLEVVQQDLLGMLN